MSHLERNLSEVRECVMLWSSTYFPFTLYSVNIAPRFCCISVSHLSPSSGHTRSQQSTIMLPQLLQLFHTHTLYLFIYRYIQIRFFGRVFFFLIKVESLYLPFPGACVSYSVVKHDHDLEDTEQKQFFFKKLIN